MGLKRWAATLAAVTAGGTVCAVLTGFVPTDADAVNASEAIADLQQSAPEAVAGSAGGAQRPDAETAAMVRTEAGTVLVPTDAAQGIHLGGEVPDLTIGLPFAQKAGDATESGLPGVVVYDNNNGSSTVPVIRDNGSVQINTVIDGSSAPKRYAYPVAVPADASLRSTPGGGVESFGAGSDAPVLHVEAPWAKDAHGQAVPTHFEVSGRSFVQVVDFTSRTAFPATADPAVYIDRTTTQVINVVNHGVQTRWKYLNSCTAAARTSCSVSRTYTAIATVQTALNASAAAVGSSIGISAGVSDALAVTCGVTKGPATVRIYAQAVKKTYQIRTTRTYGVSSFGSKLRTAVKTSGTLAAFKPNGRYSCV